MLDEEYRKDHDMEDKSTSTTQASAQVADQVIGNAPPPNPGDSLGGASNTSNNIDESALQNLNVSAADWKGRV